MFHEDTFPFDPSKVQDAHASKAEEDINDFLIPTDNEMTTKAPTEVAPIEKDSLADAALPDTAPSDTNDEANCQAQG